MTQRERQKARRAGAKRADKRGRIESSAKPDPSLTKQRELDYAELRAELAAAQARIKVLESQRADIVNRIDWVIDSIHNILERET